MSLKDKEYLTSREAAEMLGVAVSTIQLWSNNGSLQAWVTEGGHRRITRRSVENILAQNKVATKRNTDESLSIVVVEDNAQQLRLYEKQFRSWRENIDVVTATDGYEGLVKIGQTSPRIIITDLKMPNMDGFQMIKALKKMPDLEGCLIVVVTGLTADEIKENGGLPEGVHVFIKPVSFTELKRIVLNKADEKAA